jgi:hypothetical protein
VALAEAAVALAEAAVAFAEAAVVFTEAAVALAEAAVDAEGNRTRRIKTIVAPTSPGNQEVDC